ncbi:MAG: RNA-binding protein [Francisellaceae bacterium]|nr:RNA-binding protein [Francisellaceae bacterium]MBT6206814.1 RNA-binding protein [Francisellaceae bacterium]MBT6539355.1 RNA-binding protein [Francisellaceae bacterium]
MLADDADDIDDIDDIDETDDISPDAKLYVGNIDYSVTESELKDLFTKFGEVDMVNIPVHRHSGRTRGFGFVTFLRVDHASKALKLNGTEFRGRSLQINYAKSKAS